MEAQAPAREASRVTHAGEGFSVVWVTAPDAAVGKRLARELVQQGLAACVNVVPSITSVYVWQGDVHEDEEVLLMAKTRTSLLPRLTQTVIDAHPYDVPEVISVPLGEGSRSYLDWVAERTASQVVKE